MLDWFRNIRNAILTVANGMLVTLRYWVVTYDPKRKTFTDQFAYPELPVPVAPRYRGFHRYDLTTCIACDQCAKACPVDCIYIGKERVTQGKGFKSRVLRSTTASACSAPCALILAPWTASSWAPPTI
jgi:NADH-quinone oxidoreductase subunit I